MKRIFNNFTFNPKNDILSGLTVALALVPEAVAFAFVAGVTPLSGLYAAFLVGLELGIDDNLIINSLKNFSGVKRLKFLRKLFPGVKRLIICEQLFLDVKRLKISENCFLPGVERLNISANMSRVCRH